MKIINTSLELKKYCEQAKDFEYIALDTEFIRDTTYFAKLCLIQAGYKGEGVIIDPLADAMDLSPFFALLKNPKIVKVFHACKQDVEIFYFMSQIMPEPLFDVQIAASALGYGENLSYDNLAAKVLGEKVDKTSRFTDWAKRPLSQKQLEYALGDVTYLCHIYEKLVKELVEKGRVDWIKEDLAQMVNRENYDISPVNAWLRMRPKNDQPKTIAVLKEVAAWREEQAQNRNSPRQRIMRDDVLNEISYIAPKNAADLDNIRGLSVGFSRSESGRLLLKAIEVGLAKAQNTSVAQEVKKTELSEDDDVLLDLLKVLLKLKSRENNLSAKLVADIKDLESLIVLKEFSKSKVLQGWRYNIFGTDALDLINGKITVKVIDKKVTLEK